MLFEDSVLNEGYDEFLGYKNFYMERKQYLNYPF